MYNHILFDADNTLLDFNKAEQLSFKRLLHHYDVRYSDDIYHQYEMINHKLWELFEKGEINSDTVQQKRFELFFCQIDMAVNGAVANDLYQAELSRQSVLVPFAEEICRKLSQIAMLTIVTNGAGKTQRKRIENSAISKYISYVIISEDIGYAKPSKHFFDETFRIINRKPDDKILIVGDSLSSDIIGGIQAGIDTCWFNRQRQAVPDNMHIDFIIDNLMELLNILPA